MPNKLQSKGMHLMIPIPWLLWDLYFRKRNGTYFHVNYAKKIKSFPTRLPNNHYLHK